MDKHKNSIILGVALGVVITLSTILITVITTTPLIDGSTMGGLILETLLIFASITLITYPFFYLLEKINRGE